MTPRIQRLLQAHVLKCSTDSLILNPPCFSAAQESLYSQLVSDYLSGTPLSRLLGYREFWSCRFYLNEETLDPRPDSETLIEAILETFPDKNHPLTLLDLGTGTGCLGISLLTEYPKAEATLIDISPKALLQAQENAHINGVEERCRFVESDWLEALSCTSYTLILSNPPYIEETAFSALDKNVQAFDPKRALISGKTGIECYEKILHQLQERSLSFQLGFFEIGMHQEDALKNLFKIYGFHFQKTYQDIEKRPRVLSFSPGLPHKNP
tara:strand:+ start:66 stop:869 length:804 start_codon:yes stop_codon:yes gene_type:complete